jgi:predicted nucleotidyltransferase
MLTTTILRNTHKRNLKNLQNYSSCYQILRSRLVNHEILDFGVLFQNFDLSCRVRFGFASVNEIAWTLAHLCEFKKRDLGCRACATERLCKDVISVIPVMSIEAFECLHEEISKSPRASSEELIDDADHILRYVDKVAREAIEDNCKARLIGSYAFGIATPESEIDVVIIAPGRHKRLKGSASKDEMQLQLRLLARRLRASEGRFGNTILVDKLALDAEVPLIICSTKFNKKCNIYFGNQFVDTVDAMSGKMSDFKSLRSILFVLKKVLRAHNVNDASAGGLSSYALFHLALSFISSREDTAPDGGRNFGRTLLQLLNFFATQ